MAFKLIKETDVVISCDLHLKTDKSDSQGYPSNTYPSSNKEDFVIFL